jgi:rubredoxin---NAD+ reductase
VTKNVVIIGSGLGGYTLAKELRKLDASATLTIITKDDGCFYSKPMLSNAYAKNKTAQSLAIQTAEDLSKQLSANLLNFRQVVEICADKRYITTDQGEKIPYDDLVLAIGAHQRKIYIDSTRQEVPSVNNLEDYARLRQQVDLQPTKTVGIIGGGLIGCEFANDLALKGIHVTLFDQNDRLIARILPEPISLALQSELEKINVTSRLAKPIENIQHENNVYTVTQAKQSYSFDYLLSATGLIPNIQLAKEAGIHTNIGIIVNDLLSTNIAHIYALGDCIEWNKQTLPYILPLMSQAKVLAKTLAGNPTPFVIEPYPITIKTPNLPIVAMPPTLTEDGAWVIEKAENQHLAIAYRSPAGQLRGFSCSGHFVTDRNKYLMELSTSP